MNACTECESTFAPKHPRHVTCSKRCGTRRATRRWVERRHSDPEFRERTKEHVRRFRRKHQRPKE